MVRKLNIKESNNMRKFTEADKGYSRSVYKVLDQAFKDDAGKAELVYISDAVDMWLFKTQKLYDEIWNNRRKATSIAYEALIDLFQDTVDGYDVKVRVTSEMVKQWFKKNGLSYIEALKPVVDKIEEERAERKAEKKESVRRRRYVKEAKSFRKTFTQKELKDMIRRGEAIDITNYSFEDADDLYDRGYDVIGVCRGVYGLNGALLKMRDTGELCAITARNSTLMQLV